jgi:hypothetical protein
MAITHKSVTIGTSATAISTSADDKTGTSSSADVARSVLVTNPDVADVFVGGPDVTTTSYGYKIVANGGELALDLLANDQLYGVVESGTAVVRVMLTGV